VNLLVITATKGEGPFLADTIRSVAEVGCGVRHVLVCPAMAAVGLAQKFSTLEVMEEEGGGLYAALNTARRIATEAELVTWINDDDLVHAVGMREACKRLKEDSRVAAVYGGVSLIDSEGCGLGELPVAHREDDLPALMAAGIMPLAQPGTVIRREALERLNWFDASYRLAGDLDLFVRALQAGMIFGFVEAKVASFRLHVGQLSKNEMLSATEFARAIVNWRVVGMSGAVWRFRWDNRWVYLRRIRLHGFKRMQSLYRRG
jgi:glycosyltransferase involved in cell wall biosynthesis